MLGNVNNIFALRVTDTATQEYITDKMPKTRIKIMSHTLNQTTSTDTPLSHSGVQGQTLQEEEADLFQPAMLGQLPNLEYLANLSGGLILKGRIPILVEEKQKETSVEEKHQTDAKKETRQIEQPKDKALSAQKPEKDKFHVLFSLMQTPVTAHICQRARGELPVQCWKRTPPDGYGGTAGATEFTAPLPDLS